MLQDKCNYSKHNSSFAAREFGCPLDHCMCGTHDVDNHHHTCPTNLQDDESVEDEDPIRISP